MCVLETAAGCSLHRSLGLFSPDSTVMLRSRSPRSSPVPLALLGSVAVQSGFRGELQLVFEAGDLRAVAPPQLLQASVLSQLRHALLVRGRGRGAADEPLQVVPHRPDHEGHGERDVGGVGTRCGPEHRPHGEDWEGRENVWMR